MYSALITALTAINLQSYSQCIVGVCSVCCTVTEDSTLRKVITVRRKSSVANLLLLLRYKLVNHFSG